MMKHLSKIFVAFLLIVLSTNVNAQVTTSGISGIVTDQQTKEPLIGVNIVLTHVPTGTVYGAATNSKGVYSIQGLRPGGPYTVKATYIGFQSKLFENINLDLGENYNLNIWLKDDTEALQQIVVTADRNNRFNLQRTGAASSFGRKAIENTPSISRSIFDIASLTPQASSSGNGTSFAGSNNRYNSFQIDGTVSNDVFGLSSSGTNGGQTGANPISLEAIDAVQVVIAPFDVRQSGFTGGGINAITKSGTNNIHGSIYGFFNNQDMYGKDPIKGDKVDKISDRIAGFTIGGPIVKDKVFLFLNGEYTDSQSPLNYTVDNGSQISKQDAESVQNKLLDITNNKYNGGGFGPMTIPQRAYKALARLDWNIAQGHRLTLRYSFLNASKLVLVNYPNKLNFDNSGYNITDNTNSFVAELNSRFNNSFTNEFRFGYNRVRDQRKYQGSPFPRVQIFIDKSKSSDAITVGSEPYSTANQLNQDMFSLTDNLSWTIGDHNLTLGTSNEFFSIGNLFIRQKFGSYIYYNLKDFLSIGTSGEKMPYQYNYTYVNDGVKGAPLWWANLKAAQLGFYLQDEWTASSNLRLTYGLRVDVPLFFSTPTNNAKFNNETSIKDAGLSNTTMPSATPLFSPRIGFRYSIDQSKKVVIRGGVGIFTGRVPFVWLVNSIAKTGVEVSDAFIRGSYPSGFKFNADPNNQYKPAAGGSPEVDLVSKKFKFPQVARANIAFDAVLYGGVKATIEAMFSKNINDVRYKNIWFVQDGKLQEGKLSRPKYKKISKDYYNVILLENTDKGYSYNITGQLSKSFDFGLYTSLAYTYGHSYTTNPGTSSQATSNWKYNPTYYGDSRDDLSWSPYDLGHRIVGTISYRKEYLGHFATTISLVYNGQSGHRFSILLQDDINGDYVNGNDLPYLSTENEASSIYTSADMTALNAFINQNDLGQYRGKYIPRNALRSPFTNNINLHFAQEFFFNIAGRRQTIELNADVVNLANLLNSKWGRKYSINSGIYPFKASNNAGKISYTFTKPNTGFWNISPISSRWHAQIGLKYKF